MRQIKFRSWDKEKKIMMYNVQNVYDNSFEPAEDKDGNKLENSGGCSTFGQILEKYPTMQFIGIKDKTGKDIYEGDILKYPPKNSVVFWSNDYPNFGFYQGSKGVWDDFKESVFEEGWFTGLGRNPKKHWKKFNPFIIRNDLEIIGNIYENQELLN